MRKLIAASTLALLSIGPWLNAELVTPRLADSKQKIMGHGLRPYVDSFKANARAVGVVSGNGDSCLAIYVFDSAGNCVAADDRSDPATCDDCALEWYPLAQGKYSIEVRNLGPQENAFEIRLR